MDYTDSSPTPASFYDSVADAYAELLPDVSFEAPLDLGMVDQLVASLPGEDPAVLDAGCGTGRMLTHLRSRGIRRLHGLDVSPRMIEIAASLHSGVQLTTGDLVDLPYPDGTFDGVLAWYSIIHTPPEEYPRLLGSLDRVLARDGLLLLAFQEGTGTRGVGGGYGASTTITAHRHRIDDLAHALVEAGFTVEARAERAPRATERDRQGFLLARASRPREHDRP